MTESEFRKEDIAGEWVKVWAQATPKQEKVHPDDARIEFWSHNEQYSCHVRLDRIERTPRDQWPDFISNCNAMRKRVHDAHGSSVTYLRCELQHDHAGKHRSGDTEWDDNETDGYIEDNL